MNPGHGEILVALDLDGPALAGSVRVGALPATPFTGWLGLFSVLQMATELLTSQTAAEEASLLGALVRPVDREGGHDAQARA